MINLRSRVRRQLLCKSVVPETIKPLDFMSPMLGSGTARLDEVRRLFEDAVPSGRCVSAHAWSSSDKQKWG
jgi:hypothetical protein